MHGIKRPVILDVKIGDRAVGSFEGEPAFETVLEIYSKTNSKQREEALQMYHQCKKRNNKNLTFQDLKLSLSSSTSSEDIHFVMKHLAQRKRIEQTASSQLGFRIAGSNLTSKSELKKLNAESTIKYISDTFLSAGSTSEKIQRARNLLRALVPVSDYLRCNCRHRFYSSFDTVRCSSRHVARHWVDFFMSMDVMCPGRVVRQGMSSCGTFESFYKIMYAHSPRSNTNTGPELERYLAHIAVDIPYAIPSPTPPTQKVVTQHILEEASSHVFDFSVTNSPQRKFLLEERESQISLSSSDWNSKDEC